MEKYCGNGKKGTYKDVYAIGAVIYRCVTRTIPPDAPARITGKEITQINESGTKLSKNVDAAVMRALALNIPERWQHMVDFKNALSDPSIKISTPKTQTRSSNTKKKNSHKKSPLQNIWIGLMGILVGIFFVLMVISGKIPFLRPDPSATPTSTPTITPFPTITSTNTPNATVLSTSTPTKMPYVSGNLNIGDEIVFGTYEQNNIINDGKEGIEWRVLTVENEQALVISKFALDTKPYHVPVSYPFDTTWESSDIRAWLNQDFFNNSFTASEKGNIISVSLKNSDNPEYGTKGGTDTTDRIFLLSYDDVNNYFDSLEDRECEATSYAKATGAFVNKENEKTRWWLRTPGYSSGDTLFVEFNGDVPTHGNHFGDNIFTIRPAFWLHINPSSIINQSENTSKTYVVSDGDNCWAIAENFGISLDAFMNANNMVQCNINIGDIVIIP